jgi:hypothetical protein
MTLVESVRAPLRCCFRKAIVSVAPKSNPRFLIRRSQTSQNIKFCGRASPRCAGGNSVVITNDAADGIALKIAHLIASPNATFISSNATPRLPDAQSGAGTVRCVSIARWGETADKTASNLDVRCLTQGRISASRAVRRR